MVPIILRALSSERVQEAIAAIVARVVFRANEDQLARLRADLQRQTAELRGLIEDLERRVQAQVDALRAELVEHEARLRLLEREAFGELPKAPPPLPRKDEE